MSHSLPGKLRRRLAIEPLEARTVLASAASIVNQSSSPALVSSALIAPSITLTGEATVLQNDVYQLQVTVHDLPTSSVTVKIDWGDGRLDTFSNLRSLYLHTYAAEGRYVVAASLLNANQQVLASATILMEVLAAEDQLVDSRVQQGLQAELFGNSTRSGTPVFNRIDPLVDFDFGIDGPDPRTALTKQFSARWTGTLTPTVSGVYQLFVNSGATDGVKLTLDSVVGIDTLALPTATPQSMSVRLSANVPVNIRLDYVAAAVLRKSRCSGCHPIAIAVRFPAKCSVRRILRPQVIQSLKGFEAHCWNDMRILRPEILMIFVANQNGSPINQTLQPSLLELT